jgi:hypothetical protein
MAPSPKAYSLAPRFMMATSGYSTSYPAGVGYPAAGYSPEFYDHSVPSSSKSENADSDDEYTYARAPRSFTWLLYVAVVAIIAAGCASVWWWNRGADMMVSIAPLNSAVTFDGEPLAVTNGQAMLPAVKRGPHMLVVKGPDGGTMYHSVDVGFFESTATVDINLAQAASASYSTRSHVRVSNEMATQ